MSDTPKTDAALKKTQGLFRAAASTNGFATFARELEREGASYRRALNDIRRRAVADHGIRDCAPAVIEIATKALTRG